MLWFWIVIIANFCNAGAQFLDKLLISKSFPRPAVLTFWTAIANLFGLVFVFSKDFNWWPAWSELWTALLSGAVFTIALQFFYMGMKKGEASHIAPLTGGLVPVFSILFSYLFFSELLTSGQLIAVFLLSAGALLIASEKSDEHDGWHIGVLWAFLAGLFFALSYALLRFVYLQETFATGFAWARIGSALAVLPLLFLPGLWRDLSKKQGVKIDKKGFALLGLNKGLAGAYALLIGYAISLQSATLVNALAGAQYAILFVLVIVFTYKFPKILKEKFTKSEISLQIFSLLIIVAGLALLARG